MEKHKRKIMILTPGLITLIKMLMFIPVKVSGGFAGEMYNEHVSLFKIMESKNMPEDVDWIYYDLLAGKYIFEGIVALIMGIILAFLICMLIEKIKQRKGFSDTEQEEIEF